MPSVKKVIIEFRQLVRFGITGTIAALAYAGVTFILVETGVAGPVAATTFGYFAAAAISYLGHLHFSFGVEPDHRTFLRRFAVIVVVTFAMNIVVTWLTTNILNGSYRMSVAVVTVLIPVMNYLCNRFWVFLPGLKTAQKSTSSRSSAARSRVD